MIAAQHPELVFACIALIKNAITSEPKDKVVKSISGQHYAHHGNLVVTGDLKIRSLMVTGNLTVKGRASNVQGCQLFVGGDLECETMYTEGPVIIGGNLSAKKIETYYNDYALEVKQTLQADTLIIDHHQVIANHFDVKERIEK
jgi:cytoskeletal protein CcmA (bactofilin family)